MEQKVPIMDENFLLQSQLNPENKVVCIRGDHLLDHKAYEFDLPRLQRFASLQTRPLPCFTVALSVQPTPL